MINLKNYIIESIFDTDEDTIDKSIKDQIKQFLKDNFDGASLCKISDKPNKDGKYEVSSNGDVVVVKKKSITSLTNGLFIWTTVDSDFNCETCHSLTTLEGAPEKVGGGFNCSWCRSLTSLEGAPKEVGNFDCYRCASLTSLEGAPEKVGGHFDCNYCSSLISLEGAPKEVGGRFSCARCKSLKSLKGAPKKPVVRKRQTDRCWNASATTWNISSFPASSKNASTRQKSNSCSMRETLSIM